MLVGSRIQAMPTDQPLASFIVVCYNHARFVIECLESIRAQTYKNTELIVMDDCSKDNSVQLIRAWIVETGTNCTFIAHKENKGLCRTLNEALGHAHGKYVGLIATDDAWLPDKTEQQVAILETAPADIGVVYSDAWQMDEEGKRLPEKFIEAHCKLPEMPEGDILPYLVQRNFIPAMTTLVRRSCYAVVGEFDERLSYEDWDMWLRIAHKFKFAYSPVLSAKYRIVSTSLSRTLFTDAQSEVVRTQLEIDLKLLEFNKIDSRAREFIMLRVDGNAALLYAQNYKERGTYYRAVMKHNKRVSIAAMWLSSALGIRYKHFIKGYTSLGGIVKKSNWVRSLVKNLEKK